MAFHLFVVDNQCTTFHCVEDFGGMETEGGEVSPFENRLSIFLHTESVCRIVDYFQPVLVGYFLYSFIVAGFAVAVYRKDGGSLGRDGFFYPVGVNAAVRRVYIHKDGFQPIPPDAVGGSHKTIGCGDYLSFHP